MATKEEIYDKEINPLMAKIIEICKEGKIPLIASFYLGDENDPDLYCSTVADSGEEMPETLRTMARILF